MHCIWYPQESWLLNWRKQHYIKAFADFSIRIFRNLSCRNIVIRTFVTQKWSDLKINLWTCKPSNLLFTLGEASEHLKGRTVPPVSYFFLDQPKDFVIFLFLATFHIQSKHLKGRSVPRVSDVLAHLRILSFLLFLDTFRIQWAPLRSFGAPRQSRFWL